jgi:hypothetical protein
MVVRIIVGVEKWICWYLGCGFTYMVVDPIHGQRYGGVVPLYNTGWWLATAAATPQT